MTFRQQTATHNFIRDCLLLWWCTNYINTGWNVLHSLYHTRTKRRAEYVSLLGCDMVSLESSNCSFTSRSNTTVRTWNLTNSRTNAHGWLYSAQHIYLPLVSIHMIMFITEQWYWWSLFLSCGTCPIQSIKKCLLLFFIIIK